MCDQDIQERMLACLERLENHFENDEFESGGYWTVGGIAPASPLSNLYAVRSPFNTECEWALISVFAETHLATFAISENNGISVPDLTGATAYGIISSSNGNTWGGADGNAIQGLVVCAASNNAQTFTPCWLPLPGNALLYVAVGASLGATPAYVTVAFRRKLLHVIPNKPRSRPHAHTPLPRRAMRAMPAQGAIGAGFESMYPSLDGQPYQHQPLPVQDTSEARHGVFPLGQTQPGYRTHKKRGGR